ARHHARQRLQAHQKRRGAAAPGAPVLGAGAEILPLTAIASCKPGAPVLKLYRQLFTFWGKEGILMNLIHIDENGLHLVFERKEDGTCKLLHFSALPFDEDRLLRQHDRSTGEIKVNTERYNLLEIMISGQDRPGERHGNKYISTAPGYRMQLVDF